MTQVKRKLVKVEGRTLSVTLCDEQPLKVEYVNPVIGGVRPLFLGGKMARAAINLAKEQLK